MKPSKLDAKVVREDGCELEHLSVGVKVRMRENVKFGRRKQDQDTDKRKIERLEVTFRATEGKSSKCWKEQY